MAEKPPERLFRDDGGAALERVAQLEDENRELRARLSELERPRRDVDTVRTRPLRGGTGVLFLVGFTLAMGASVLALFVGAAHRPRPQRPHAPPVQVVLNADPAPTVYVSPGVDLRAQAAQQPTGTILGTSPEPESDCTKPYWYDERNVKHYKKHCLAR